MPGYYSGQNKRFSKKKGRWETVKKERVIDYDTFDKKSWGLLISFFRFYPDIFFDIIRDKNAPYGLELPQRLMFRIFARYQNVYITGARGITKSFVVVNSKLHDGIFYPREQIRYYAPSQKQSAKLASQAFAVSEKCYPILTSWWNKNNDREEMFKTTTPYGSEVSMYAPRGDNFGSCVAEEMAQEGEDGFNFEKFEEDVKKGHRLERTVNGQKDRTRVQLKFHCISNASTRQNKAYTIYRQTALREMLYGEKYDGFCMDISWISALLCNIRGIPYYKKEKATSTQEVWLREMCARYTGNTENHIISDEVLARAKKLMVMENKHCGDEQAIYVVSHDVSYEDSIKNAKCADTVVKLTLYTTVHKRDKYRKQVVYVDAYPPPKTAYLQAEKVKELWRRFCLDGGNPTYLVIDAHAYGREVVEELMKPTQDGSRPLCCYNHMRYTELEQDGALPIIYPLKATSTGKGDVDSEMVSYAQLEFEQGNVELLTSNMFEGLEQYKLRNNIKDDMSDRYISLPYKHTEELCQQIMNLKTVPSGTSIKEQRISKTIQRDIWSALKYALRMARILEDELKNINYKQVSDWSTEIERFSNGGFRGMISSPQYGRGERERLLSLRKK